MRNFLQLTCPTIYFMILLVITEFIKVISHSFIWISVAANKGEAEPERKETRVKVDEDRKHEYPFEINLYCKLFLFGMRKGIGLQIIFSY